LGGFVVSLVAAAQCYNSQMMVIYAYRFIDANIDSLVATLETGDFGE
jgi:hypothetical protein